MKTIIGIIIYGLSLYLVYKLYKKYNKILWSYADEIIGNWPDIPNWLNWALGIFLFAGCIIAQITVFFESIVVWLILLIIVPFFYLPIKNSKTYNMLSVLTLFLTMFFAITLFFNVDNSRDVVGKLFVSNYNVYYTTEYYQTKYDGVEEVSVAHVNTGNEALDFVLESIFPYVYGISIILIIIFSLLMNVSLKEKNNLIRKIKNEADLEELKKAVLRKMFMGK